MKACEIPPPGWPGTVGIFVKRLKFRCLAPFVMTKPAMKKSGSKAASPIVDNTTVNTLFKTRARESRRREAGDKVSEPVTRLRAAYASLPSRLDTPDVRDASALIAATP